MKKYLIFLSLMLIFCVPSVSAGVLVTNFTTGSYTGEIFTLTGSLTSSTTWKAPAGVTQIWYDGIGAGAGGGYGTGGYGGGGGSAGQHRYSVYTVTPGNSYTVTLGRPGDGGTSGNGETGANSVFDAITFLGGAPGNGQNGVNGGGGSNGAGGTGSPGHNGGSGSPSAPNYCGGSAGSTSANGNAGTSTVGGSSPGANVTTFDGTSRTLGDSGGGGCYTTGTRGMGGTTGGNGGNGANPATNASSNSGSGGGGGNAPGVGGRGGSPIIMIRWGAAADTTPPNSIRNLVNTAVDCNTTAWGWDNPLGSSDYYQLVVWKNNVLNGNLSNSTTTASWTGLSEGTSYTFSSKTKDLVENMNLTFVNASITTAVCPTPSPTPTPTSTTTTAGAAAAAVVTTIPERRIIPWWDNDKAPVYLGLIAIALIVLFRRR